MKSKRTILSQFRFAFAGLLIVLLVGCAMPVQRANHGYGFDTHDRVPKILVLDFHYGNRKGDLSYGPRMQTGTTGDIEVPASIYAKWRREDTGETFTRTVNLKGLLPNDMEGKYVNIVFSGPELLIFLEDRYKTRFPATTPNEPFKPKPAPKQIYPAN